ncbi:MAG TPA: pyridine nucleotide-disulfide oxidoreductase, partial [Candidatus Hydrogenedentes bacterium]|nr:pyridine nucleotide-disulfide oxidoreductase [Candidatus Hydrogenedentota bacterium]
VNIYTNANTSEIKNESKTLRVVLESGKALPARIVTITTGVRANTHLARRAGLQVQNGIVVDSRLRTSNADIFAAGDAAEWDGIVYGLWEPARRQGAVAGQNAAGADMAFGGMPRMNTLKVLGIDLFCIGVVTAEDGGFVEIAEETDGVYRRFLFHDNRLVGAILIGDTKIAASATRAIKEHANLSHLMLKKPAAHDIVEYLSA